MARGEDQALTLGDADARRGTAEARVATHPHLDEHQRAVTIPHDQIDLAAARARAAGDPILRRTSTSPAALR